ncbi:unnamed protein product, partial [Cuscuta europaea]
MFEDEEEDNSVKLFFEEYMKKFVTAQDVTHEVTNHCDFHTETHQPFDLPLVSTTEEGKEKISHDDGANGVGLGIEDELGKDNHELQESDSKVDDLHDEEVSLHIQDYSSYDSPVYSITWQIWQRSKVSVKKDFISRVLENPKMANLENAVISENVVQNDVNDIPQNNVNSVSVTNCGDTSEYV